MREFADTFNAVVCAANAGMYAHTGSPVSLGCAVALGLVVLLRAGTWR